MGWSREQASGATGMNNDGREVGRKEEINDRHVGRGEGIVGM